MHRNFRDHHTLLALERWESGPLDLHLSRYFKGRRAIGSKDRRVIGEQVYGIIRHQVRLDYLGAKSWEERLQLYQTNPKGGDLPTHVQAGLPKEIFEHLKGHYGQGVVKLGRALGSRAPTTLRANGLKCTRDELISKLGGRPCERAPEGIVFDERVRLLHTPEFKAGLFELQDEASQLAAALARVGPGDEVLDYCAGSGGKALALAPAMGGKGQLYLHDIRRGSLMQAKQRLKRAGVQNGQIVPAGDRRLKLLKGRIDWLFVDAPCSGSGAWRRSPEQISRFSLDELPRFVALQREVFANALRYLAPGGKVVYATCSLFPEENEEQVAFFTREHGLQVVDTFQSLPSLGGMDGMYGVTLCAGS